MPSNTLDFYCQPGEMTDPGVFTGQLAALPRDIPGLVSVVQGLMVHIFWAQRHGLQLDPQRQAEVQIRPVQEKLARIQELSVDDLNCARPLEQRLVGNCRDYSLLLCSILQSQGIPARARCGFGTYFIPGHYEDHWICEYWRAQSGRWIMVDAQLDPLQIETLKIDFDPLDVPGDRFLTGGKAWQLCRTAQADPERFGIFEMHGLWFVRGDLLRDFYALNKLEILPWDVFGLIAGDDNNLGPADYQLLDHVAELTLDPDAHLAQLQQLFQTDSKLAPPPDWAARKS